MDKAVIQSQLTLIPGVLGANLSTSNDSLTEVHILADDSRKAKEIMLDVKSLLAVVLQQPIDFRIISIAQIGQDNAQSQVGLQQPLQSPRLVITAAYLKRLSNTEYEGVVEMKLSSRDVVGRAKGSFIGDSLPDSICRAFVDALRELLPDYGFRPRVQFLGGYCLAEVQMTETASGEAEDFVGAVKLSGDQPWDVSKAILSALNRKLELLLQEALLKETL